MRSRMIVVAGPPGSGKSSLFPVSEQEGDHFNADDRAAELNARSYQQIPASIRDVVNREFGLNIRSEGRKAVGLDNAQLYVHTVHMGPAGCALSRKNAFRVGRE